MKNSFQYSQNLIFINSYRGNVSLSNLIFELSNSNNTNQFQSIFIMNESTFLISNTNFYKTIFCNFIKSFQSNLSFVNIFFIDNIFQKGFSPFSVSGRTSSFLEITNLTFGNNIFCSQALIFEGINSQISLNGIKIFNNSGLAFQFSLMVKSFIIFEGDFLVYGNNFSIFFLNRKKINK